MTDPLFWLVLSFLFVTVSLTIVLVVAIPTLLELARAARSAEKLFDTLRREFPPTLEAIRLTGLEISDLTDDVSEGVQSAGQVVKQVDQSLSDVRRQARKVRHGTRSVFAGVKAAWRSFSNSKPPTSQRRSVDRLPPARSGMDMANPPLDSAIAQATPDPIYVEDSHPSQTTQSLHWATHPTPESSLRSHPSSHPSMSDNQLQHPDGSGTIYSSSLEAEIYPNPSESNAVPDSGSDG